MSRSIKTEILILGAGIGGYETFRSLSRLFHSKRIKKRITLIDKNNYFTFTPMLHEVASGSIEPGHCAIPIRELVHNTPHNFIRAEVKKIKPNKQIVNTSQGQISYEYCVVALGSETNYFGIPGAKKYSYHVRDLSSAIKLQEAIISKLESVSIKKLCMTIVGGGFTGVEIAGQMCDLFHKDISALYPHKKLDIKIIESGDAVLKYMPNIVRRKITSRLSSHGVKILNNVLVKKVTESSVYLDNGQELNSNITIWCGGFKNIAEQFLPKDMTENGRIPVNQSLHHVKFPNLYGVGDIIFFKDGKSGLIAPQLGEAAHKEGIYVANHITKHIKGKKRKPFKFTSLGTLIPVGDWYGVAIVGRLIFFGRIAWWIRRTIYLLFLPGLKRKIKIIIDWTLHASSFRYIIDL